MSLARSAGDELRLALRSVRAALTSVGHARESQRIDGVCEREAQFLAALLDKVALDVAYLAAACDASDARWRATRDADPRRGRL